MNFSRRILLLLVLGGLPYAATAQFTFTTNNGAITITGYIGSSNVVIIPDTINGLPVTIIGTNALSNKTNLRSIVIPDGVIRVESSAFVNCSSLTNIVIPNSVTNILEFAFAYCSKLPNVTFGNGLIYIGHSAFGWCSSLTNIFISSSVTSIEFTAFVGCTSITSVTIPSSVISIGDLAFYGCSNLTSVFFQGNYFYTGAFNENTNLTVYYLPGRLGWGQKYGGVLWNPSIPTTNASFGVQSNQFGFTITGTTNIPIVVEASTNLASGAWTPLLTATVTNGAIFFSDPAWTNYPARTYRIRSP